MASLPKQRDRTKENFDRSCKRGAARLHKISKKYGARVYVQVCWRGRHYEYTSHDEPRWPRTKDDLETMYPLLTQWTPATFVKQPSSGLAADAAVSPPSSFELESPPFSQEKPLESEPSNQ
jgi:hypothetical protein